MSGFYLLVEMIYETAYSNIVASKYDTNRESNEDDISSGYRTGHWTVQCSHMLGVARRASPNCRRIFKKIRFIPAVKILKCDQRYLMNMYFGTNNLPS